MLWNYQQKNSCQLDKRGYNTIYDAYNRSFKIRSAEV